MEKKKVIPKSLASTNPVVGGGHNRRISPFDRTDMMEWGKATKKLEPIEALASSWLSDAAVLKRHGQTDMAKMIEQHAKELKEVLSGSSK